MNHAHCVFIYLFSYKKLIVQERIRRYACVQALYCAHILLTYSGSRCIKPKKITESLENNHKIKFVYNRRK